MVELRNRSSLKRGRVEDQWPGELSSPSETEDDGSSVVSEAIEVSEEEEAPQPRRRKQRSNPPMSVGISPLMALLERECSEGELGALSEGETLNLLFELSGYPHDLYSEQDYKQVQNEDERIALVDGALDRTGQEVGALSPLMSGLLCIMRTSLLERKAKACYTKVMDIVRDSLPNYVPRFKELTSVVQANGVGGNTVSTGAGDSLSAEIGETLITGPARLMDLVLRLDKPLSDMLLVTKNTILVKEHKMLVSNLPLLVAKQLRGDYVGLRQAETFVNFVSSWLVLFSTSNIRILRTTGVFIIALVVDELLARVVETLESIPETAGIQSNADQPYTNSQTEVHVALLAGAEVLLQSLKDFLLTTVKDRVNDVYPVVAVLSLLTMKKCVTTFDANMELYSTLIQMAHIGLRHPSALVRLTALDVANDVLKHLLSRRKVYIKPHLATASVSTKSSSAGRKSGRQVSLAEDYSNVVDYVGYTTDDVQRYISVIITSLLSLGIKHARDCSLLVSFSALEFLETCVRASGETCVRASKNEILYEMKDPQVTGIAALLFADNHLPVLPVVAQLVDGLVFASSIVHTAEQNSEVIYSTLVQFLTDYADDPEWIPYHSNVLKAFLPLSPYCRDLESLWNFLRSVYRPTALDITEQREWLNDVKACRSLLFITHCMWKNIWTYVLNQKYSAAASQQNASRRERHWKGPIVPCIFGSISEDLMIDEMPALATVVENHSRHIGLDPNNPMDLKLIDFLERSVQDFPNILSRARADREQTILALSLLYEFIGAMRCSEESMSITSIQFEPIVRELVGRLDAVSEPSIKHSILACLKAMNELSGSILSKSSRVSSTAAVYDGILDDRFGKLIKETQGIIKELGNSKNAPVNQSPISRSTGVQDEYNWSHASLSLLDTLRQSFVNLRVFMYNDTKDRMNDNLDILDEILNMLESVSSSKTGLPWDHQVYVNGLDVVWLSQAKLLQRITRQHEVNVSPYIEQYDLSVAGTPFSSAHTISGGLSLATGPNGIIHITNTKTQKNTQSNTQTIAQHDGGNDQVGGNGVSGMMGGSVMPFGEFNQCRLSAEKILRPLLPKLGTLKEDLEIYKELSLQLSCYLAQYSEKCRKFVLGARNSETQTASCVGALIAAFQCCRLLVANSLFQAATGLWSKLRVSMNKLRNGRYLLGTLAPTHEFGTAAEDVTALAEEIETLRGTISRLALACHVPPKSEITLEIAYFIDSLKQIYARKRRELEAAFDGQLAYGFLDQFMGSHNNQALTGPVEVWDVYKNLLTAGQVEKYCASLELEQIAFNAQVQITAAISQIPDRHLWRESSVGPVILSYFRSRSGLLRVLADRFMKRCMEYDSVAAGHVEDITDRPLLMSLILSTLQTLIRRAPDNLDDVKALAGEVAAHIPKTYWKGLSDLLFMNFVWMAIQRAHDDPKGQLLSVLVDGLFHGRSLNKRWTKHVAANQLHSLKLLEREWQDSNKAEVHPLFFTHLAHFLRVCVPNMTENILDDWPPRT